MLERLQEPRRHAVLDLGPPIGSNVDFFAQAPCTLVIEDLHAFLKPHPPPDPEESTLVDGALDALVAPQAKTPFDYILGWDLFTYLDRRSLSVLVERLTPVCRPGTLFHMVVSTRERIPLRPCTYRIQPGGRVRVEPGSTQSMHNPRVTPAGLERSMPQFRMRHSFLSQSGFQEYLLSLGSDDV